MKSRKQKGMNISMAQFKWAFRELYGRPYDLKVDGDMHGAAGTKMFTEHGREGIEKAIANYTFDAYVERKDV